MSAVKNLSIRLAAVGGDKVRQEFKNLGIDGDKAFRQITQVIQPANDNLKALDATARSFNEVIRQGTALFGAYLGLQGLKNTFSAIFSANTTFEQLSGSLKTVTGSAKGAQEAFSLIEKFAIDTPYQLNEIVEAFIQLKALGLDPSEAALVSYGNTASAFGKNIKDFVGAVSAATVGEFERLKTFGIKAKVINDDVSFTFAGVTTKVKKNAAEIEKYLRTLGDVNFAGAMNEQMKTMNGVLSNIEDGFEKIYRDIGKNGLNETLKSTFTQFNELVESGGSAAKTIGQTLAFAVNTASSAFFLLSEYADVALTLIGTRLGSSAIFGGINLLKAGIGYLQVSMAGLSISAKSAVTGIAMMSRVSKLAAVQMGVTAAAAGILKGALALIGGPAGLAILAGMAIYKLMESHDVAKRAANDHAETLQKLKDELKTTADEAARFSAEQSKDIALAEWGLKLKTAEQNIRDLRTELKNTGGISLITRLTPNTFLKDYEIYAKETADILRQSKIDLEQYQKEIWEIAAENPDFQPQAKEIQDKILLLKAAEKDAWKAREELKYLQNPELRPKGEVKTEVKPTVSVDAEAYKKNIEDIKQKILELKTPYEQAMAKADEWHKNALNNLNSSSADYQKYKDQIGQVYDDMVKKANETALQSSKSLEDGFKRGFLNIQKDVNDFASLAESAVKNAFNRMEDTLTSFITTGKASFSDFANAIISDLTRIIIRQSITQPLMNGLGSYLGFAMAHTGGIVGADNLATKSASSLAFADAPRFHSGGIVGDEVPIIAKRGEGVFTKEQMKALGDNGSTVNISVNVVNNAASDVKASVSQSNQGNGKFNLDIMIEKIESSISRNVSKGTGIAPALERRYGLNPAYGSYG
uniref:Tail tape measure n=1 Tax=Siphoviridae sp. ctpbe1 TaxID=2826466 RepID=A0A8S5NNR5_9CAUD|nr:MAG TPA: tail tape measure [Siphoviridae sp. ctpbe1]